MARKRTLVTYKVKPEQVEENEALVRNVYRELRERGPGGTRYATFRLDDGVTFVHLHEAIDGDRTLPELDAFKRFQAGIRERCDEPPKVSELTEIGSLGVFAN